MKRLAIAFLLLTGVLLVPYNQAFAAPKADKSGAVPCPNDPKSKCYSLGNPLQNNTTDVTVIIGIIIKGVLGVIGSVALFMMVWGGFQWFVSAGNQEKIKSGTNTMVWAAIGVVLVFSSYLLLTTYIDYLTGNK